MTDFKVFRTELFTSLEEQWAHFVHFLYLLKSFTPFRINSSLFESLFYGIVSLSIAVMDVFCVNPFLGIVVPLYYNIVRFLGFSL